MASHTCGGLFFLATVCTATLPDNHPPLETSCNAVTHHPENNGYYIEGVGGVHNDDRDESTGKRADNTVWAPGLYYPHMEVVLCDGMFCSEEARVNGTEQYISTHTCALLRFSYDAPSNVYEMADREHFDRCDFTGATLRGAEDVGQPYYDYVVEVDHEKTFYYFASNPGCTEGQRVAFNVVDDYTANAAMCASMAAGSSRIQNCDCNHQFKETTLIEPCFSAFQSGCLADMPDDLSCCNADTAFTDGAFSNCGTCIPKSKGKQMLQTVNDTINFCSDNAEACSAYVDLSSCPSSWSPDYDPMCSMWKSVQSCVNATGDDLDVCGCDLNWVVYQNYLASLPEPELESESDSNTNGASTFVIGKLVAIILALAPKL